MHLKNLKIIFFISYIFKLFNSFFYYFIAFSFCFIFKHLFFFSFVRFLLSSFIFSSRHQFFFINYQNIDVLELFGKALMWLYWACVQGKSDSRVARTISLSSLTRNDDDDKSRVPKGDQKFWILKTPTRDE